MKGFDRPIKPEWVYNCSKVIKAGDKLANFKEELEAAIPDLKGDGNRKARGVIARNYFIDEEIRKGFVAKSEILSIIKSKDFETAKNFMFLRLLCKEQIFNFFSKSLIQLYEDASIFSSNTLKNIAIEKKGDRDIAGRSIRNFLNTLVNFEILKNVDGKKYAWNDKIFISEDEMIDFIKIYSESYLKDKHVNLLNIPEEILFYFDIPDLMGIANKFNGVHWDYMRRTNSAIIVLY